MLRCVLCLVFTEEDFESDGTRFEREYHDGGFIGVFYGDIDISHRSVGGNAISLYNRICSYHVEYYDVFIYV